MLKKILLTIICLFVLVGCSNSKINEMTFNEIIDDEIKQNENNTNINNKGYKYYLPNEFSVSKDSKYIQELMSKNNTYYLNIDVISYYYKNKMSTNHSKDTYEYYEFSNDKKNGYLKIEKNNDNFFIELCYNYAIIEVEVEESELRYAVSRSIIILNSIKYNDLIIEKYIVENDLESSETIYEIPEPENKNSNKNILEYIDENENEDNEGEEDNSDSIMKEVQ